MLGGEYIRDIFSWGKLLELPPIGNFFPTLLMPGVGFEPTTFQSLGGGVTPGLAHCLDHSATEDWSNHISQTDFLVMS